MSDIKEYIEKLVSALQADPDLMKSFQRDPVKAVEKVLKIDLPDELIEKVVAGVKAKISLDDLSDALGTLKKFF